MYTNWQFFSTSANLWLAANCSKLYKPATQMYWRKVLKKQVAKVCFSQIFQVPPWSQKWQDFQVTKFCTFIYNNNFI